MLAMQYSIPLPVGYDETRVRERVRGRSALFDALPGLMHKSFLYNDADKLYAPFYVWKDVGEAQKFLLNGLFKGVIETFQRHRVRSWLVLSMAYANRSLTPAYALREIDIIPPEAHLDHYLAREKDEQQALLANPDLYMHLIALDADRWEIVHFSLWRDKASAQKSASDCFSEYDVLHVSMPAAIG